MRLIVVTLPVSRLEAVRESLARRRIERLTIADAHGSPLKRVDATVSRLVVVEVAVNEDFLEPALSAIAVAVGQTAESPLSDDPPEQGVRIDVLTIHETIQLYRAVRGAEAI